MRRCRRFVELQGEARNRNGQTGYLEDKSQKGSGLVPAQVQVLSSAFKGKITFRRKITMKTNQHLTRLVQELKKQSIEQKVGLWKRIARDLDKPTRKRRIVNLSRINRYSQDNDVIIVPGKVLSSGSIDKKVTVAAFNFSHQAVNKIIEVGGKAMSIRQLLSENPKAKNVKIIG